MQTLERRGGAGSVSRTEMRPLASNGKGRRTKERNLGRIEGRFRSGERKKENIKSMPYIKEREQKSGGKEGKEQYDRGRYSVGGTGGGRHPPSAKR